MKSKAMEPRGEEEYRKGKATLGTKMIGVAKEEHGNETIGNGMEPHGNEKRRKGTAKTSKNYIRF